jgi:hypothetical protein
MNDSTDKMAALDWSLPPADETEITEEEIQLDMDPTDASDGAVWEWNGSAWVAVSDIVSPWEQ